jgi:molecular chaperone Hsp33
MQHITGCGLLGALLDPGQRVALKFTGNGPLKKIIVEAADDGMIGGYVEVPQVDLHPRNDKFDVGGALGREGLLTVTKDLRLKDHYNHVM